MADIASLLNDFITTAESKIENKGLWRETPVDFLTFFKSKDYLGEKPYPGKQTELVSVVNQILWWKFTKDPTLCKEEFRTITELLALLGKGSGKDFMASGILAYVCYLLCCMNDPQKSFGFGKGEPIDLVNMAINAYQANNVFFKKLKARITNCKWFKRVASEPKNYNEYQLTKNQIRFYKNITAHSAHSEAESYEGFNPLVVIFDEIGGFDYENAKEAYSTLRSSAVSRFNDKILLIFISFPRSEDDFMYTKYEEAIKKQDKEVYTMIGKTWEVNPKIKRSHLQKDYDRDPEGSATKYECRPPKYREGLFRFPEKIDSIVVSGVYSQCQNLIVQEKITSKTLENGEQRHFIGLELFNLDLNPNYVYYLGGDGGVETDSYALSLFHAEPVITNRVVDGEMVEAFVNKPVEDLLLQWQPSKQDRLPVDLLNVAEIIEMVCKQVRVKKALFDKFNSAEVVQRLLSYGVEAEDKNFSNTFQLQIYTNLKGLIYTGQVSLLDHIAYNDELNANEELKAIKLIKGNKIDHDKDKSKDFSDARAAAVWICSMDDPEILDHFSLPALFGAVRKQ